MSIVFIGDPPTVVLLLVSLEPSSSKTHPNKASSSLRDFSLDLKLEFWIWVAESITTLCCYVYLFVWLFDESLVGWQLGRLSWLAGRLVGG